MGDIGITPAYQWQYDEDGRMIQVTDSLSKTVVTSYNQRGMKTTLIYSGGRNQVFAYDEDGRNISIDDQHAIKVQGFDYQFDANGNRIETKEGSVVSTYVYDAVDRLIADNTSGTGAHTFAYSYDSRGNILTNNETGTTITHTYDAASRLTTSIEGSVITTYTFDLNGNMTVAEKGANAAYMTYDPENQMGSHEDENGDATYYSYDPHSHLKQDVRLVGTNRWYVWQDDLIVRQDDTSGLKRIFTVNDGVIVGEVYSVTAHAQTRSYLEDFLGSVTGEMSTTNVVSNSRRFTPYGRDWLGAAAVPHSPAWIGGHGYHPTGLKWAGYSVFHRVVTPETGQWTTRDMLWPEELAYAYVNGNPTTWIDPSGLYSVNFHPDCGKDKRERIEGALFGLCGALRRNLDGCLSNRGCNRGGTMAEAFAALCDGTLQPPITVQCPHWSDPVCYTWGRGVLCAKTFGKGYIVLCQGAFDNGRCPALTCLLMHELFHAFGVAAHTADVFKCLASQYGCQDAGS